MIIPAAIRQRFTNLEPELNVVAGRVRETVFSFCESEGFAYSGRAKTLESLAEKIESGRYAKWSELDDLFGCVVIVPTLAQEADVLTFLRTAFLEAVTKERGSSRKPPDSFRFDATRFIGRLRPIREGESELPRFNLCFEVQVRSAFEHAWSVTTHALSYKSGTIDWKTQRLAAQLKAAVEQLDSLVLAFAESSKTIIAHDWPEVSVKRIIAERFTDLVNLKKIPEELAPKDWSRFADNLFALIRSSKSQKGRRAEDIVIDALDLLAQEIELGDSRMVPHSVSLLQFSLGVLAKRRIIEPPFFRFCPLITDDLLSLYPEVSRFIERFEIDK
jgi:ppGpp synthetase/RelA/SpoT-type nucleotidyltranferase